MNTRTAEYLTILSDSLGSDFRVEGVEWKTEWNTTHYQVVCYSLKNFKKGLSESELELFKVDGIAGFLDKDFIYMEDTFDEAILSMFDDFTVKKLI